VDVPAHEKENLDALQGAEERGHEVVNGSYPKDDNGLQHGIPRHSDALAETEGSLPTAMVTLAIDPSRPHARSETFDDSRLSLIATAGITDTLEDQKSPEQTLLDVPGTGNNIPDSPRRDVYFHASSKYLRPTRLHARRTRICASKVVKPGDLAKRTASGIFRANKLDRCRRSLVWGGRQASFVLA
jgi:hypothetical protein